MSYIDAAANNAGSAADTAAERKTPSIPMLEPNESTRQFQVELGRKIAARSGDDREGSFLFQRFSVLLHGFNSVLLHDSLVFVYCPD